MKPIEQAAQAQRQAAHPERSTWVSANAGSGKTRVLTNRVARLLLAGCPPQKILCLTYTKAAAAEMQNRLFAQLGEWAMMPDDALKNALQDLGETHLDDNITALARTLFARALETPGGLKIQTIHSFCSNILRRFPMEAGVSPRFQEMDERQSKQIQAEIVEEIAQESGATFGQMAKYLTKENPEDLLKDVLKDRALFEKPVSTGALAAALKTEPDITDETILAEVMQGFSDTDIEKIAAEMAQGLKADITNSEYFNAALGNTASKALDLYQKVFLTEKGEMRKGNVPTLKVKKDNIWIPPIMDTLKDRMCDAREKRLARRALGRTIALHAFALEFLHRYDSKKSILGLLDFDDLVGKTRALLTRSNMAAWVLYRLDGGIEHILVDEAQDTSPTQWDIVRLLAEEFTTGGEDRAAPRTLFVVGDEKQSIFSFQGADPAAFQNMRNVFAQRLGEVKQCLQNTELLYSFRTAAPILRLVDQVFTGPASAGLSGDILHRQVWDMGGRVELWPFVCAPEKAAESVWYLPLDAVSPDDPHIRLAGVIAARVAEMIRAGTLLPHRDGDRPVTAGDFLILVQSRQMFFHAIIKALKAEGVEVAGADRLKIIEELAVKDLLALLAFLVTPDDDLSLAAVLRSPLFGLSEGDLFHLAYNREGSLWQALQKCDQWTEIVAQLVGLRGKVDYVRPHDVLQNILINQDGRRKLLSRLGSEAADGIDELLNQSLHYESVEAPSLAGFLDWISADDVQVKRQMDAAGGRVRVMTVHGAKGLEAPIVILPDTRAKDASKKSPDVLEVAGHAFWKMASDSMPKSLDEAESERRRLVLEENRRLLYVALTRAENWLIICGAGNPDKTGESWFSRVQKAMETCGAIPAPAPKGLDGEMLALMENWTEGALDVATTAVAATDLPPALEQVALTPPRARRTLAPSDLEGAHSLAGTEADADAMERGTLIHQLLEILPMLPESQWPAKAAQLIPHDSAELLAEAARVIEAPELQQFFGPDALIEVPVTAALNALDGAQMTGRIDRLLIGDAVLAIDFKSNRQVPETPSDIPEGILRQMGAYHAALEQIYPHKQVRTAIIWTCNAKFMEIPANVSRDALSRASAP